MEALRQPKHQGLHLVRMQSTQDPLASFASTSYKVSELAREKQKRHKIKTPGFKVASLTMLVITRIRLWRLCSSAHTWRMAMTMSRSPILKHHQC
jgi:hypothetical protein